MHTNLQKKGVTKYWKGEKKSEGKTIILTSNNFEEIENVCDRVVYLNKGKIIADFYKSEVLDSNLEVISVFFKELPEISIFDGNFEVLKVKKEKNEIVFLISKNPVTIQTMKKLKCKK